MKKQMIQTVAGLVCGLALLAAPAAHAEEIQTLWAPTQPQIETVTTGSSSDAASAVNTLFNNMLCATNDQNHYIIGQKQGQYLQKVVDVPPTQVQNKGQNTIYLYGQVQQGGLKGSQMAALFTQTASDQIDARLRLKTPADPHQVDVTVHFQMKLIWKKGDPTKPDTSKGFGKKGDSPKQDSSGTPPVGGSTPPGGNGTGADNGTGGGTGTGGGNGTGTGGGNGGSQPAASDNSSVPLPI
jgi:hypothetical protein